MIRPISQHSTGIYNIGAVYIKVCYCSFVKMYARVLLFPSVVCSNVVYSLCSWFRHISFAQVMRDKRLSIFVPIVYRIVRYAILFSTIHIRCECVYFVVDSFLIKTNGEVHGEQFEWINSRSSTNEYGMYDVAQKCSVM